MNIHSIALLFSQAIWYTFYVKKESKNLGISKPCPECKKTLINFAEIEGKGSFRTKCPHCGSLIHVEIKQKHAFTLSKVIKIVSFLLIISLVRYIYIIDRKITIVEKDIQVNSQIIQDWDIKLLY